MQLTVLSPSEKRTCRGSVNQKPKGKKIMGDKSPKSVHKQAAQKQMKANAANQKKQQAAAVKQPGMKMK